MATSANSASEASNHRTTCSGTARSLDRSGLRSGNGTAAPPSPLRIAGAAETPARSSTTFWRALIHHDDMVRGQSCCSLAGKFGKKETTALFEATSRACEKSSGASETASSSEGSQVQRASRAPSGSHPERNFPSPVLGFSAACGWPYALDPRIFTSPLFSRCFLL